MNQKKENPILDLVVAFFDKHGMAHQINEHQLIIVARTKLENGSWPIIIQIDEERGSFRVLSMLEEIVPEAKRVDICEFECRANHAINFGCFDFDLEDGRLCFKIGLEIANYTAVIVNNTIVINMMTFNSYLPAIKRILHEAQTAKQSLADIDPPGSRRVMIPNP